MPALEACLINPIWDQFAALLPPQEDRHPLGCHRPRIPDRVVFDKLVLVFGCAYARIADGTCSATTLRRRRDAWIAAGVMDALHTLVLEMYDRRPDSPLLDATLDTLDRLGPLPNTVTVHLDRGYDSGVTRQRLAARGMHGDIAERGIPAPLTAGQRWVVERTHAWTNAFRKLVWCTERRATVVAFWLAFAAVIIIIRRLLREGWTRYRWDGRPCRKP